ncbi:MAG TPA: hypothetical protein DCY13_13820 [Verrucomicrobiales bacterium]|nr:hypothetical protein [Verrucomicrobiales bacterium]
MNTLPVISRELHHEARNGQNYWLRVAAAGVMIGAATLTYLSFTGPVGGKGWELFGVLQPTLYTLIWLLVPIMTCDCISRERRESTLGLLFLTPLRPVDVLVAKATSSVLRALSLFVAAGPVIVIMLLLGGVAYNDLLRAVLMDLTAMLCAISAGLIASSRCTSFRRSALLAVLLGITFMIASGLPQGAWLLLWLLKGGAGVTPESLDAREMALLVTVYSWAISSGVAGIWSVVPVTTSSTILWLALGHVAAAALLLLACLWWIGRGLRIGLVETGLTAAQARWWRIFCSPTFFTGVLQRWNRRQLNRNPVGWLQRRTWSARIGMWGWVTAYIVLEMGLLNLSGISGGGGWEAVTIMQPFLAGLLFTGLAFSAADSLREERETGALELLLVTPLTVRKVILGRLFGLWGQYLPAFLAILFTWFYVISADSAVSSTLRTVVRHGWTLVLFSSFLTLPVIGLRQSLHRRHFLTAWMLTLGLGLVGPLMMPMSIFDGWSWGTQALIGQYAYIPLPMALAMFGIILLSQLATAAGSIRRLVRVLNQREFLRQD